MSAQVPVASVVAFRRMGWTAEQYTARSVEMTEAGTAFVVRSRDRGEPIYRFCFVNPRTITHDIEVILRAMV